MSTPWPIMIILTGYLLFVLKIGPKIMENREPFKLKYLMMAYNLTQTLYNLFIVSEVRLIFLFCILKFLFINLSIS